VYQAIFNTAPAETMFICHPLAEVYSQLNYTEHMHNSRNSMQLKTEHTSKL